MGERCIFKISDEVLEQILRFGTAEERNKLAGVGRQFLNVTAKIIGAGLNLIIKLLLTCLISTV